MSSDTVTAGSRFGFWTVVQTAGRAALVQCACGSVRRVAIDALTTGVSTSCGCYGESYVVRTEIRQRQRQREQTNWRGKARE